MLKYKYDPIPIAKIDATRNEKLANDFKITGVPSLFVMEVRRVSPCLRTRALPWRVIDL